MQVPGSEPQFVDASALEDTELPHAAASNAETARAIMVLTMPMVETYRIDRRSTQELARGFASCSPT
jgi:hypothetical protein